MANDKLTWTELRKAVAEYANTSEQEAGQFLNALLGGIVEGLKADKQVKIKGLGSFALKAIAPRKSVNIATGEAFTIEGYNKLTFSAESMLKESVEKRLEQPKTEAVMAEINNDPIKKLGEQADEIVDILAELGQAVSKPSNESLEVEKVLEVPTVLEEEIAETTEEPAAEPIDEPMEEPDFRRTLPPLAAYPPGRGASSVVPSVTASVHLTSLSLLSGQPLRVPPPAPLPSSPARLR